MVAGLRLRFVLGGDVGGQEMLAEFNGKFDLDGGLLEEAAVCA